MQASAERADPYHTNENTHLPSTNFDREASKCMQDHWAFVCKNALMWSMYLEHNKASVVKTTGFTPEPKDADGPGYKLKQFGARLICLERAWHIKLALRR